MPMIVSNRVLTAMAGGLAALGALAGCAALGLGNTVTMHAITESGVAQSIGTISFADSDRGLVIRTDLAGLTPGQHGFHVHENADCGPAMQNGRMMAGMAAGGHLDPGHTGQHKGPTGQGHLGDLPAITAAGNGTSKQELIAPRLKLTDIANRAVVIHAGGDNYADKPEPMGGGGARVACGIVR